MKPAIRRPPLMTSSIAYSSATRIGLSIGTRFPTMASLALRVRLTRAAPIRLQLAIRPYGLEMMLIASQPVEPALLGVSEAFYVAVVKSAPVLRIECLVACRPRLGRGHR